MKSILLFISFCLFLLSSCRSYHTQTYQLHLEVYDAKTKANLQHVSIGYYHKGKEQQVTYKIQDHTDQQGKVIVAAQQVSPKQKSYPPRVPDFWNMPTVLHKEGYAPYYIQIDSSFLAQIAAQDPKKTIYMDSIFLKPLE
ncbi:hypothetical protein [Aureispira anguillae]|uniref:Lipoprotein n=1 Tax=Aureispira anguillae TaxID=2864201 RepID=A0A915YBX5_9BACT|nr:hypothetical protein [Aureispira anguillae]BDS10262.1 hypothetical protein AsAng_0009700 [Aureispira anguillae]